MLVVGRIEIREWWTVFKVVGFFWKFSLLFGALRNPWREPLEVFCTKPTRLHGVISRKSGTGISSRLLLCDSGSFRLHLL
jgi:hypothetical protein